MMSAEEATADSSIVEKNNEPSLPHHAIHREDDADVDDLDDANPKHQKLVSERPKIVDQPLTQRASLRQHLVVDREKTCPMLLRMFCREHGHHRPEDFSRERQPTDDELIIYTWYECVAL